MTEHPGADIIAFPGHFRARPAAGPVVEAVADAPADPGARLAAALAMLDAALTAQREAVADWRQTLGALRGSVQGLGSSLHEYHDSLGALGDKVVTLNAQARALAARV